MFRLPVVSISKRLYHDSSFKQKMPIIKRASPRVLQANRKRLEDVTNVKVPRQETRRQFEPFPFLITSENRLEVLRKAVTPLHDMPYEEQLESKQSYCKNALRHIAQRLFKSGTSVRLDVTRLPCKVHPILPSKLYNYRNTNEFSVWRGIDGKTITVGFNAFPISKHGDTVCLEPNGCDIMHPKSIELVEILQEFIRNQAKLSVCYSLGTDGGWRRFIIKNNSEGDLMLIGIASPRNLRVGEVIEERDNFRNFITEKCSERGLNLKSLYFQPCANNRCPPSLVPFELLHGESTISEKMNEFMIQLTPTSSFIQSTEGGKVLYEATKKTIEDCFGYHEKSNTKPLIIDVNSGDGILSLHLAKIASKLVGIENNENGVDNAKVNMKLNRIENIEFICSSTEIVLERVLEKYKRYSDDKLVVCQAKKLGLHSNAIEVLRNCSEIRKIIYITSEVGNDGCIENLLDLCKKVSGKSLPPFALISATPVDAYPHLVPCELVIALERLPE